MNVQSATQESLDRLLAALQIFNQPNIIPSLCEALQTNEKDLEQILLLTYLLKQRVLLNRHLHQIELNKFKLVDIFSNSSDKEYNLLMKEKTTAISPLENRRIYLSSPLSELSRFIYDEQLSGGLENLNPNRNQLANNFKAALEDLQVFCKDNDYELFLPHQYGDPKEHPDRTPNSIYIGDFAEVITSAMVLSIHPFGSTGLGMETEMAITNHIPIYLSGSQVTLEGGNPRDTYITRIIRPNFIHQMPQFIMDFAENGQVTFDMNPVKESLTKFFIQQTCAINMCQQLL